MLRLSDDDLSKGETHARQVRRPHAPADQNQPRPGGRVFVAGGDWLRRALAEPESPFSARRTEFKEHGLAGSDFNFPHFNYQLFPKTAVGGKMIRFEAVSHGKQTSPQSG